MALDPAQAQKLVDRGDISQDFYNKIINPIDNQPVLDVPVEKSAPSAVDNFISNAKEAGAKVGAALAGASKKQYENSAVGNIVSAAQATKEGVQNLGSKIASEAKEFTKPNYFSKPATASNGLLEKGNIDLTNRPRVQNADGSISTVRSLGVNVDGQEVLIPTVSEDGRIMSDDEAIDQYRTTGRHLGKFADEKSSTAYANSLHEDQAKMIEGDQVDPSTLATLPAQSAGAPGAPQMGSAGSPGAGIAGAFNQQKNAIMGAAKVGAEQAAAEAAYTQTAYDEAEKMRVANDQKELARVEKLKGYETKLNDSLDAYAKAPKTIADKFANASTGQKILMGISLFLGAAPNSSGQNKAVQVMQNALDKDIEASKGLVDSKQSIYKEMRNTFQDEHQADAAARLAYINNTQLKLNQIASQYKSPLVLKNAEVLMGQLEVAKQQELAKFAKASAGLSVVGKTPEQLGHGLSKVLTPADLNLTDTLARDNAAKVSILNQIDSALQSWDKLDDNAKLQQGRQLLKVLNSTQGKDAIGAEESKRLGGKLEYALGNFTNDNPVQFGRDLEGFKKDALNTSINLKGGLQKNQKVVDQIYAKYGLKTNTPKELNPQAPVRYK